MKKLHKSYHETECCLTCIHVFVYQDDWDSESEYCCHADGSERPNKILVNSGWDQWSKDRKVKGSGKCDVFKKSKHEKRISFPNQI